VVVVLRRRRARLAAAALAVLFSCGAARGADLPRLASLNVCTDQLLLALADPAQIVGLSPYARDPARSFAAAEAARYRSLSGEAEDVLILKPDIVLAFRFTRRATREMLKAHGLRVVEFDVPQTLDDVKRQIVRMGELAAHPDRAAAAVARLDAAIVRARRSASPNRRTVLPVSRRGWVSGADTLIGSLLAAAGLSNPAAAAGLGGGGFASLEKIVSLRPDFILVDNDRTFAEDQGSAFLFHPALEALYPPAKRIVMPERLTVCGGPMLVNALDRLHAEIARVSR
jgi:iron complex transport system substrate-binding protein